MAIVLGNRAKMSTSTTGTGTITLGSALSGYQTFAQAGITNGQTVRYTIEDGTNFEIGSGVFTSSGTTLTRNVTESTNSDNAINLSGSGEVFITASAADIFVNDGATSLTTTGVGTFASLDISGDIDVDGTTNLDAVDIDGAVNIAADLTIASTNKILFNDASQFIQGSSATVLSIAATDEIDLSATTIDINGAVALNGAVTGATNVTLSGELDAATGDFATSIAVANVGISTGVIDLQNGGSQSVVRFYCEASNAHYAEIKAPAHGSFSGNVTLTLPATTDTIAGIAATQTFTNKTLTSPVLNTGSVGTSLAFPDNAKALFGAGSDLEIYSDGNNSIINEVSGTGSLLIQGSHTRIKNGNGAETMAEFLSDGGVGLYHNNVKKIETTASGISVSGNVIATGTVEPAGDTAAGDNAAIGYTAAEGLILTGQGSTSDVTIKNDADATVMSIPTGTTGATFAGDVTLSGTAPILRYTDTDNTITAQIGSGTSDFNIATTTAHNIDIRTNNTRRMVVESDGDISFYEDTGSTAKFFWDASTERLGIGTTSPAASLDVTGNVIATGTVEPAGDTAAGDNAAVGYTAAEGLILTGQGSTNDVTIKNDADADVIEIPTGTTSVTMTGSLKPLTYQETYVAKSAASTVTCDLATGTSFSLTMDQNTTFAFTNPPGSGTAFSFTLFVTQHSTAVTLTWPNTVDWAGGSAPDAAGNNEVQAYAFFTRDGGTTYYGFLGGTAIA